MDSFWRCCMHRIKKSSKKNLNLKQNNFNVTLTFIMMKALFKLKKMTKCLSLKKIICLSRKKMIYEFFKIILNNFFRKINKNERRITVIEHKTRSKSKIKNSFPMMIVRSRVMSQVPTA
jgi:hypothetical protein